MGSKRVFLTSQANLYEDIKFFDEVIEQNFKGLNVDLCKTIDRNYGRIEKRISYRLDEKELPDTEVNLLRYPRFLDYSELDCIQAFAKYMDKTGAGDKLGVNGIAILPLLSDSAQRRFSS